MADYRKSLGSIILVSLLLFSLFAQSKYNLEGFLKNRAQITQLLKMDDLARHYALLGPVARVIEEIEKLPKESVLYFVPVFGDTPQAKENSLWWWHLDHILRYFCYPRKIVVLHFDLYGDKRQEYLVKFMKGAKRFSDLDWIRSRGITYIILYRDNRISILPASTPVEL